MRPAWLLLLAVSPALAAGPAPCVIKTKKGLKEPPTLSALVDCQKKKLAAASAAYHAKKDGDPSDEVLDGWLDRQREETRAYIARHPERAALDNPKDLPAEEPEAKEADSKPPPKPKDAKPMTREEQQKSADELGKKIQAMSDGGKSGVTPEMARQINDYLMKNQGQVSPDMQALLDSVQKDGGKLSDDTVNKLKDAARQAKQNDLDLNTDKKTEEFLLAPKDPPPNSN